MDAWWNDFVGIPYLPGGADEKGCDCWGLVRLVYRRRFGMELPGVVLDVTPGERPEAAAIAPVLDLARDSFWERVSVPQPGDVAVFRVRGYDSHVGLVTMPGYMLHVREGHDAVIEAYDRRFWKNAFRGVYRWKGTEILSRLSAPDCVTLIGKPSPFAPRLTKVLAPGATLADIVTAICDEAAIPEPMRKKGVAFVDHAQVPFERWASYVPRGGSVVFFRLFPEGGKAFKMIAGVALIVAALVISVYTFGTATGAELAFAAKVGLGALSLGLNMAGSFLMNSSMQKSMNMDGVNVTDQKFLGGGNNRLPKYKVIPQVLGTGRMTLDYLAMPYTERVDQYTSYLRAAYTAGYGPVAISDVRNGDTPLGRYQNMEYKVYRGDGGDQKPSIFTRDAWEDSPNITLKQGVHNYRQTAENVDQIQIVLYWPQGLWYRSSAGKKSAQASNGVIRWRSLPDGAWNELQAYIAPKSFTLQPCTPVIDSALVYDESGALDSDDFWLTTYGVPKKLVSEEVELELYRWYTFAFNSSTGNIVMHQGTATDSKGAEPSERLLKLLREGKQLWNTDNVVGRLAPVGENEELLAYVCVKGDEIVDVQNKRDSVSVTGCDITTSGLTVSFSEGTRLSAGSTSWGYAYSNQTRAFTRQFTFSVPRGKYEVDVRLTSADDEDVANWKGSAGLTVVWQTLRTYTNGTPFKPRKPLAWLEMRVKATDQLNGTLDLINAKVSSVVLDYDYKKKTWVKRASSNPAALFRHVLQGPGMPAEHAVPDERLDLATLERWHNYCRKNGFTYFKVVGGDSGLNVFDLLIEIAAAGRAKPILRPDAGGLWTVLIDEPKTQVTQLFTEHNSWGWTWTKSAVEPPHAVRATFVDKTKGYEENTVTVYADGYSSANATKYENWGVEYFEGITEVANVQRAVRRAIAYSVLRSETLSFYVAQEHLVSEIGDLVMCENSFVQWGLGSGWVEEVLMQNGKAVGLRLSADVTLTPGTEYGIRVRRSSERGASRRYDLAAVSTAEQTHEVRFASPLSSGWPEAGDLYQFGYRERESHQCIIESIRPEANGVAQISVCDYAPELIEIDDIPIPAYQSDISTPQPLPSSYIGSVPLFDSSYSDERALVVEADGSLRSRIAVQWKNPATLERHATHVQLRWAEYSEEGDLGTWMLGEAVAHAVGTAYCSPVEEGGEYRIEARYVSDSGVVGPWELMQEKHKVIGGTLPPPDVESLTASIRDPKGIELTWPAVDAPDLAGYEVNGTYAASVTSATALFQPFGFTGDASFEVRAVDKLGHESEEAATASVTILAPKAPAIRSAQLLDEGIVAQWASSKTSWSIDRYDVKSGDASVSSSGLRAVVPVSVPFAEGSVLTVQARDIFGNWSETSEAEIAVYPPKAPVVKLGYDPLSGKLTVDWQDCQNAVTNAPGIARYDIAGTLANQQSSSGVVSVQGTHYEALVPLTAYEYGAQADEDGIEVNVGTVTVSVTAVDKWGVETQGKEVKLSIWPPYNPARMALSASEEGDSIVLSWRDCKRTFAIDHYLVYDQYTKQSYKVATNYVVLPARPEGEYSVTVQAVDIIGNDSASMPYVMRVGGVGGMDVTARVDGADILLEWSIPDSTFVLDHYVIMRDNDELPTGGAGDAQLDGFLGTAKVNFFRVPAGAVGSYVYYVWAVDVAGNVSTSYASFAAVTIEEPSAPVVTAQLEGEGVGLHWQASVGAAQLPIRAWDVVRQFDASDGMAGEQDYGRLDVDTTTVPAFAAGQHTFLVRGVDSGGNVGPWGYVDFMAVPPGRVTFGEPTVIDNNVHLYWSQPARVFFPIREYIFTEEEVYEDGTQYSMEIGRVDALFANQTEEVAGTFTYGVMPVDMGGNLGEKTVITLRVSNPQGFKFFGRVDSLFNGEKDGFVLDGRGGMLGPVPEAETWDENVDRVAGLTGLDAATLTHEQKADAGYATWLEPRIAQAVYVETTDHGAIVPSSSINVSVTRQTLEGEPEMTCKIEVSQDGVDWQLVSDNALTVYATSFRHSRVTLTVTGGYVRISGIVIDLNVKQLTDYGRSKVYAADEGGTFIPFGVSFVAVDSLPKPNVLNVEGAEAFTNFVRELNPQGFRAYVLDGNNDRIDAEIDWVAYGV